MNIQKCNLNNCVHNIYGTDFGVVPDCGFVGKYIVCNNFEYQGEKNPAPDIHKWQLCQISALPYF